MSAARRRSTRPAPGTFHGDEHQVRAVAAAVVAAWDGGSAGREYRPVPADVAREEIEPLREALADPDPDRLPVSSLPRSAGCRCPQQPRPWPPRSSSCTGPPSVSGLSPPGRCSAEPDSGCNPPPARWPLPTPAAPSPAADRPACGGRSRSRSRAGHDAKPGRRGFRSHAASPPAPARRHHRTGRDDLHGRGHQPPVPAQDGLRGDQHPARRGRGSRRASAEITARSAHDSRGRPACRRRKASWCRNTRISASLAASDRASNTIQLTSRHVIR
jgi:hypothetical protein